MAHVFAKPCRLAALPDDQDPKIMMAGTEQGGFDFGQKANAFFRCDATDKAQAKQAIVCRAEVRMKFLAINAARHEKRRPAGPFLEPTHLLSSGRESDVRDAIKT